MTVEPMSVHGGDISESCVRSLSAFGRGPRSQCVECRRDVNDQRPLEAAPSARLRSSKICVHLLSSDSAPSFSHSSHSAIKLPPKDATSISKLSKLSDWPCQITSLCTTSSPTSQPLPPQRRFRCVFDGTRSLLLFSFASEYGVFCLRQSEYWFRHVLEPRYCW